MSEKELVYEEEVKRRIIRSSSVPFSYFFLSRGKAYERDLSFTYFFFLTVN